MPTCICTYGGVVTQESKRGSEIPSYPKPNPCSNAFPDSYPSSTLTSNLNADPHRIVANGGDAEGHNPDVHLHGAVVGESFLALKLRLKCLAHRPRVQHPGYAETRRRQEVKRRQHPRESRAVLAEAPVNVGHAFIGQPHVLIGQDK